MTDGMIDNLKKQDVEYIILSLIGLTLLSMGIGIFYLNQDAVIVSAFFMLLSIIFIIIRFKKYDKE